MSSTVTRWWWIRHAPVPDGGRIYGQRDLECDCSDTATFAALAAELPEDAVWMTSHLVRTRQTAAAIRAAMRVGFDSEPLAVAALAEQHLGDWQGLDRAGFFASRKSERHPHWFGPASERAPNGESFEDVVRRVSGVIETLAAEYAGRDIVAVTHGGTIRAALALALGTDAESVLPYTIDNCSLTLIDHLGPGAPEAAWRVIAVNRRPWDADAR